jgi:MOSC domain-containing protein YiiM
MFKGTVVSIHIAPVAEAAMQAVNEVRAVPGQGLEGDRYFNHTGTFSKPQPDRELTLIESEAIDAFRTELGVELDQGFSRRNIVTRDVPLNHLVEREFLIGEVRVRGIKLCEPCTHLAKMAHSAVLPGLVHRGGLRAQILTEGTISAGAEVIEA